MTEETKPAPVELSHETALEKLEAEGLRGYRAALVAVRDGISHASSATINAINNWIEDAETKIASIEPAKEQPPGGLEVIMTQGNAGGATTIGTADGVVEAAGKPDAGASTSDQTTAAGATGEAETTGQKPDPSQQEAAGAAA